MRYWRTTTSQLAAEESARHAALTHEILLAGLRRALLPATTYGGNKGLDMMPPVRRNEVAELLAASLAAIFEGYSLGAVRGPVNQEVAADLFGSLLQSVSQIREAQIGYYLGAMALEQACISGRIHEDLSQLGRIAKLTGDWCRENLTSGARATLNAFENRDMAIYFWQDV